MVINLKDRSLFLSKKKLPAGFMQMGRVTFSPRKSGLLLYHRETQQFFALYEGKSEMLDNAAVLRILGVKYIEMIESSRNDGMRAKASHGTSKSIRMKAILKTKKIDDSA